MGANAFVVAGMTGTPLSQVFRGTVCFLPAFFLCLLVMALLLGLALFLPNLLKPV